MPIDDDLEAEEARCDEEDWKEYGVERALKRSQPCPLQADLDGTPYCIDLPLSRERCQYNTGEKLLVPHIEPGFTINHRHYRTIRAKSMAAFGNRADEQNVCSYRPGLKRSGKKNWLRRLFPFLPA